jgi:hypothetical protein
VNSPWLNWWLPGVIDGAFIASAVGFTAACYRHRKQASARKHTSARNQASAGMQAVSPHDEPPTLVVGSAAREAWHWGWTS